ncbi:MAG TPA: NADPH:quinone reductase [Gemmatimonadetes bacterium]|nr:NADPH:quinone reductase [Gemmatimonadota bacterium]
MGQRVWVYEAQVQRHLGTAAEFVAIDHRRAVPLPDAASFNDGACLGIPALTAHRCVFADGSVAGQTILVTGGAGAVANYAIQLATLGGARVISTVSGPEKARIATAAGAGDVINYREEPVVERVLELTDGRGVDRVVEVEFGGNLTDALGATKIDGVIATYASQAEPEPQIPFYQLLYRNLTVRFELVFMMPEKSKAAAVSDITKWLAEGRLQHNVAEVFPLEQAVGAHQAVEAGPVGKVILNVGPRA